MLTIILFCIMLFLLFAFLGYATSLGKFLLGFFRDATLDVCFDYVTLDSAWCFPIELPKHVDFFTSPFTSPDVFL